MVGTLWLLDIAIASISALLLMGILAVHLKGWKDLRGRILLGASAFVFPLMIANIAAAYFSYSWAQSFGAEVAFPVLVIETLQVLGYSIFFVVSWKY
ncbi:MAG: hypothetical protein LYZ70_00535 [Nitrososphaerales archaeon]|nr:hypothetical protein [Nitrososphaerales archaeon]